MKSLFTSSNLENRVSVIEQTDQQGGAVAEVKKWRSVVDS